jgi:hypothetical protein
MTKQGTHRVCSCGCGRPLMNEQGDPDFTRRRFYSKECLRRDCSRRIAAYRSSAKYKDKQQKKLKRLGASPVKVRVGE